MCLHIFRSTDHTVPVYIGFIGSWASRGPKVWDRKSSLFLSRRGILGRFFHHYFSPQQSHSTLTFWCRSWERGSVRFQSSMMGAPTFSLRLWSGIPESVSEFRHSIGTDYVWLCSIIVSAEKSNTSKWSVAVVGGHCSQFQHDAVWEFPPLQTVLNNC